MWITIHHVSHRAVLVTSVTYRKETDTLNPCNLLWLDIDFCCDIVWQNRFSMAYSSNELKNPDLVSDKDGLEYQWGRSWQKNGGLVTVNCGLLPWTRPWLGPGRTQWRTIVIAPIQAVRRRPETVSSSDMNELCRWIELRDTFFVLP